MYHKPLEHKYRWPPEPYKGLNYYLLSDAPLFAERGEEIANCAAILGALDTKVLLVHGRTGTGKSSFLRAGLLPALQGNTSNFYWLRQSNETPEPLLIRCTEDPIRRLYVELRDRINSDPALKSIEPHYRMQAIERLPKPAPQDRVVCAKALLAALTPLARGGTQTLVITVDQAEELFTLGGGKDPRRDAFIYFIEELCIREALNVRLILSLRTEYYGHLCDHLRFEPSTKISPRLGLEQFMLHGLREVKRIHAAIVRPTLKDSLPGLEEAPYDYYGFDYAPDVAETIAQDLLDEAGESSTLPILQMVCKNLYENVVVSEKRATITLADYDRLGRIQGRVDAFINDSIKIVLKEVEGRQPSDQKIDKWRAVLASLVARQEGGALTTLIADVLRLTARAEREGVGGEIPNVLDRMAEERFRLLRRVPQLQADESPAYSLGHDALAGTLFQWNEARLKVRQQKDSTEKLVRGGILALATMATCALILMGLVGFQTFLLREQNVRTLTTFASEDRSPSIRLRTLLLLTALSRTDGVWSHVLDHAAVREQMKDVLKRSPVHGGTYQAVGMNEDGSAMARLGEDGTVTVQNLDESSVVEVGRIPHTERQGNEPWLPAIGFVRGLSAPVVYHGGTLYHWTEEKSLRSIRIGEFLTKAFPSTETIPWIEIAAGVVRLTLWNFRDPTMRLLFLSFKDGTFQATNSSIEIPSPAFWPDRSFTSDRAAYLQIGETIKVVLVDMNTGRTHELGKISTEGSGIPNFIRSIAFANSDAFLVIRESLSKFRVFRLRDDGLSEGTVDIPEGLREPPPQRRNWILFRPVLAATISSGLRIAWLPEDGNLFVMEAPKNLPATQVIPPLFTAVKNEDTITQLRFSDDGKYLTLLAQRSWTQPIQYRVYDLSGDRRKKIQDMGDGELRAEGCKVVSMEGPKQMSSGELNIWTDRGSWFIPALNTGPCD
jgi:hypothetical protein